MCCMPKLDVFAFTSVEKGHKGHGVNLFSGLHPAFHVSAHKKTQRFRRRLVQIKQCWIWDCSVQVEGFQHRLSVPKLFLYWLSGTLLKCPHVTDAYTTEKLCVAWREYTHITSCGVTSLRTFLSCSVLLTTTGQACGFHLNAHDAVTKQKINTSVATNIWLIAGRFL